jgi:[acyl-carrier-protein] S-malonyltransferase
MPEAVVNMMWLFPGQGSQSVGMGKDLFDASPAAREVFERADAALGRSITKLCFEGPEAELMLTANTQPAIVTTSIAALAALREAVPGMPPPICAAGHSLGEYSALVAAGALELEAAVRLVELRGRAMQQAVPQGEGAMAAVMGGDAEAVTRLCESAAQGEVLSPANFNAPGQVVIAGTAGAVARATELAASQKLKAIPLKVSAPFHCSLMQPAADAVEAALSGVTVGLLAFPIVSNVEAEPNTDPARVRELLVRQVASPVRWEQSMRCAVRMGADRALEIGPGKVLAGLLKRIDKSIRVAAVGDPASVGAARELL